MIASEFPAEPPGPPPAILVRDAHPGDRATVLEFNARLALETEGKRLDREVLARGVEKALADPDRLRYWLAETADDRTVAGQAAITREWSDWRDGWLWWLQSVYVRPDFRRRGVLRALLQHIRDEARAARDVIGLRLYVEDSNERAQRTYLALGLRPGGYRVFEDLWTERFGGASPR